MVPKELIPPAKFNLCEPVSGSPNATANGLAAVCCNENPNATMNNAPKINAKAEESPASAPLTASIIAPAPKADKINPFTIPLLNPHLFIMSVFLRLDTTNNIRAPM